MALIRYDTHSPPFWLLNGHFQTVYPALFRKVDGVLYQRERLVTSDGDFLLLDWSVSSSEKDTKSLAILSHGFEGDSHRPYIKGMVKVLTEAGIDCLAWNYRSCGGEMNNTARFYHSGATDDLDEVIKHSITKGYRTIFLVGFSLGGNLTLKYLGEDRERPAHIRKALCFSVPLDLDACSRNLDRISNRIYQRRFLNSLRVKVLEKSKVHPSVVDARLLSGARSVYAFDDLFTAPLHGFRDAHDYYTRCSARSFLSSIAIPTCIINAENDPMVPVKSLPQKTVSGLENVDLVLTPSGGHCGFLENGGRSYWSELQARKFLVENL